MKKIFTILLTFAIFTIYHYEVQFFGSEDLMARSSYLVRTTINESLVTFGDNGLFIYKNRTGSGWYKFIPWDQIVVVERKDK